MGDSRNQLFRQVRTNERGVRCIVFRGRVKKSLAPYVKFVFICYEWWFDSYNAIQRERVLKGFD